MSLSDRFPAQLRQRCRWKWAAGWCVRNRCRGSIVLPRTRGGAVAVTPGRYLVGMVTSTDFGQPDKPSPTSSISIPKSCSATLALERQIVELARRQHGLITLDQARNAGVDRAALRRRELAGLLVRMFVGVYRLVGVEPTPRQEALAACLAVRGSAVWGLSAAMVHEIPLGSIRPGRPSIVVAAHREIAVRGIAAHRTRNYPPTVPWANGRITTVPATIVDLAGLVSPHRLTRCLDHVIANRTATVASVLKVAEARPPARFAGRAVLLDALHARTDENSGGKVLQRSDYEMMALRWILAAGLPCPETNLLVEGIEVDLGWSQFKICLEISPFFTHGSERTQERDSARRRILQKAGWWVIEATDMHLVDASAFAPIIADLLALMERVAMPS